MEVNCNNSNLNFKQETNELKKPVRNHLFIKVVAGFLLLLLVGTSAHAAKILCKQNSLSLDNYNVTKSGSGIFQQPYTTKQVLPQQVWTFTKNGGYYIIENGQSGLALTAESNNAGSVITQDTPTWANNQNWAVIPLGGGLYMIKNAATGLVLDNENLSSGGRIYQKEYISGSTGQEWTITAN